MPLTAKKKRKRNGSREIVGSGRSWLPPKGGQHATSFLHCTRDTFILSQARKPPKGRRLKKRRGACQECSKGKWDHDFKKQLCLRMQETSNGIFRKTTELGLRM
jgi:hypothetical protein